MYDACFRCWTSYSTITAWFSREIWSWVTRTWQECTRRKCNWWCLCCNKWLCWLVTALVAVVTIVIEIVVIVVATIACVVINAWCLVCTTICWLGCLVAGLFKDLDCAEACKKARGCSSISVKGTTDVGGGESPLRSTPTPTTPTGGSGGTATTTDHHAERVEDAATCGCREGKLGMLVATAAYGTWLLAEGTLGAFGWHEARLLAALAFAGAIVGKAFGMTRAWVRLRAA